MNGILNISSSNRQGQGRATQSQFKKIPTKPPVTTGQQLPPIKTLDYKSFEQKTHRIMKKYEGAVGELDKVDLSRL